MKDCISIICITYTQKIKSSYGSCNYFSILRGGPNRGEQLSIIVGAENQLSRDQYSFIDKRGSFKDSNGTCGVIEERERG